MEQVPSTSGTLTRFYYGLGAIAYGVKDNGFAYLLLLYYNQVLGLPQQWVGAAIFIALLFDALSDPVVGSLSDNLHSRWGRRHPFMYGSLLPIVMSFYLLWNPPQGLAPEMLFAWLLGLAILVRLSITLYEVPSSSLVAELTDDYHQRTSFLALRHFFGWWGGLSMSVLAYAVFLVPSAEQPVGVLNPRGYESYGLVSSLVMALAILVSALGTHRHIPYLHKPPPKRAITLGLILRETTQTLTNRSFAALFIGAVFAAMAAGLSASMNIYLGSFYWEFDNTQLSLISMTFFGSAFMAFWLAPLASRILGKKHAAIVLGLTAAFGAALPYCLRMLGWFPANGSSELFYVYMLIQFFEVSLVVASAILVDSMIADVVEESELQTGRRSEGVFFAARGLVRKSVSGLGVLLATTLLTVIDFPEDAVPGEVDAQIVFDLGLFYVPLLFVLYVMALVALFAYRISQLSHEENLLELGRQAGSPPAA